jgi:hypothetical protein
MRVRALFAVLVVLGSSSMSASVLSFRLIGSVSDTFVQDGLRESPFSVGDKVIFDFAATDLNPLSGCAIPCGFQAYEAEGSATVRLQTRSGSYSSRLDTPQVFVTNDLFEESIRGDLLDIVSNATNPTLFPWPVPPGFSVVYPEMTISAIDKTPPWAMLQTTDLTTFDASRIEFAGGSIIVLYSDEFGTPGREDVVFTLAPVPEPSTAAVGMLGLIGAIWQSQRSRNQRCERRLVKTSHSSR